MLAAASASHPDEACGLLFGHRDRDLWRVEAASVAANVAADPRHRFEVDPRHLFAAQRAARTGGPSIVGVWHSHPDGPARPSAADRAGITDPAWVWIIVSPPAVAAYVPDGEWPWGFRPLRETAPARM